MKQLILFISISFFISCSLGNKKTNDGNRVDEIKLLKNQFLNWKNYQIGGGLIHPKDSCKPNIGMGVFPDDSEFKFYYADINADGKLDQLVTFNPLECDGGTRDIWTQMQILTTSHFDKFKTDQLIGSGLPSDIGQDSKGFYWFDSIGVNKVYATFYNFKKDDAFCCPSIKEKIIIPYDSILIFHFRGKRLGMVQM